MGRMLNTDYSLLQGMYWMFYSVAAIFVSVYMLGKGYSNTTIGLVIAVGNVASILAQLVISNLADQVRGLTNAMILKAIAAMLFACTAAVFFIGSKCFALTFCYTLLIIMHTTMHPFINAFNFDLEKSGIHINYGFSRSMGSLTAGIICALMGTFVTMWGVDVVPGIGMGMVALIGGSVILSDRHYRKCRDMQGGAEATDPAGAQAEACSEEAGQDQPAQISMVAFLIGNRRFLLISLGIVLIFIGNVVLENFVSQIVTDIGGDTTQMGAIAGFGALCEIPAMMFFDRIKKHFSFTLLIRFATVFFIIKILMFLCARDLTLIYLAQLNQIFGYGLIFPTMVAFIDTIMDSGEAVRGQTLFTAAITTGQVIGMVLGGIVLDAFSVHFLLEACTLTTILGAAIVCLAVREKM